MHLKIKIKEIIKIIKINLLSNYYLSNLIIIKIPLIYRIIICF